MSNEKQQVLIAAILALALGSFGVHNFILKENNKGKTKLIISCCMLVSMFTVILLLPGAIGFLVMDIIGIVDGVKLFIQFANME